MRLSPFAAFAAVILVAACGRHDEDAEATHVTVSSDGTTTTTTTSDSGQATATASSVNLKFPGGFEARVKGSPGFSATKFDIDGVGLYPGAKVGGVKVDVDASGHKDVSHVDVNFAAKSDPAAVADWYQQQFTAKNVAVTRTGDTLTGKTKDGDDFTITAAPAAGGGTAGTLAIVGK